jgi:NADP-dependent 3-hydroxy acid dehydrogenase YdfG
MAAKNILITGANRGIGREISKRLAAHGHEIIAVARNKHLLQTLADEINCSFLSANLREPAEIDRIADWFDQNGRRIDTLIYSAGIARVGKLATMSLEAWQEVMLVNLTAPFYLTQVLLPHLNQPGHIIFINSTAGLHTFPEWGAYSASKYALRALADTLREELKEKKIRITSLYPTSTDTEMHDNLPYNWNRKKMLTVENVARAVVYCTEQPENVTIKSIELENFNGTF